MEGEEAEKEEEEGKSLGHLEVSKMTRRLELGARRISSRGQDRSGYRSLNSNSEQARPPVHKAQRESFTDACVYPSRALPGKEGK